MPSTDFTWARCELLLGSGSSFLKLICQSGSITLMTTATKILSENNGNFILMPPSASGATPSGAHQYCTLGLGCTGMMSPECYFLSCSSALAASPWEYALWFFFFLFFF